MHNDQVWFFLSIYWLWKSEELDWKVQRRHKNSILKAVLYEKSLRQNNV